MRLALLVAALVGCSAEARPPPAPEAAAPVATAGAARPDWDRAVARIAARRHALATAWREADGADARAAVRDVASRVLVHAIADQLAPPWLGMPWGLGRDSTATRPFEPDHTIACSYFVGAILAGADFRLHDRFQLGQAAAKRIQESLVRAPGRVHRFFSIPPADLAARIAALGDGVYVIGLDVHVGLVVVRGDDVRFVHASYTGDRVVTDEPLATAQAIANSQAKGYFVSPVVVLDGPDDDWLVEQWLTGAAVGPGA